MNLIQLFGQLLGSGKSQLNTANLTKEGKIDDAFAKLLTEKGFDKKDIAKITQLLESQKNERKAFVNKAGIEVSIEYPIHLIKKQQSLFDGLKEQIAKLPNASEIQETGKPIDQPTKEHAVKSPTRVVVPEKESISSLNAKYHILAENAKQANQNTLAIGGLKSDKQKLATAKSTLFNKNANLSGTDLGQGIASISDKNEQAALKSLQAEPQNEQGIGLSKLKAKAEKNESIQATAQNLKKATDDNLAVKKASQNTEAKRTALLNTEIDKSPLKLDATTAKATQNTSAQEKTNSSSTHKDHKDAFNSSKHSDYPQPKSNLNTDDVAKVTVSASAAIFGSASLPTNEAEQKNAVHVSKNTALESKTAAKFTDAPDKLNLQTAVTVEASQNNQIPSTKESSSNNREKAPKTDITAAAKDSATKSSKEESLNTIKTKASAELAQSVSTNDASKKNAVNAETARNSELEKSKLAAAKSSLLNDQDVALEAAETRTNKHKQTTEANNERADKSKVTYEVNRSKIDNRAEQSNIQNLAATKENASKLAQPKVRFVSSEQLPNPQNEAEKPSSQSKNIIADSANKKAETIDKSTATPKEASPNKLWNENSWNIEANQAANTEVSASEEGKKRSVNQSVDVTQATTNSTKQKLSTAKGMAEQATSAVNAAAKERALKTNGKNLSAAVTTEKSVSFKNQDLNNNDKASLVQQPELAVNTTTSKKRVEKVPENAITTSTQADVKPNEKPVSIKNEAVISAGKNTATSDSTKNISTNHLVESNNTDTNKAVSDKPLATTLAGDQVQNSAQKAIDWGTNWTKTPANVVLEPVNQPKPTLDLTPTPTITNKVDPKAAVVKEVNPTELQSAVTTQKEVKSTAITQEVGKAIDNKLNATEQATSLSTKSAEEPKTSLAAVTNSAKEAPKTQLASTLDQLNGATNKAETTQKIGQKLAEQSRQTATDTERIVNSTKVEQQSIKEALIQTDAKKAEAKSQANISANQLQQFEMKQELNQIRNDRQNTIEAKDFDHKLTAQQRKNDADFQKNSQQNQQQSQQFGSQLNKNTSLNAAKDNATNGLPDFKQQLDQTNIDLTSANSMANANKGVKAGKEMEIQKVQETIVNQLRYTESTEWNRQRIVMDDGSSLRFNIRKVGETLQLQLIGPQSELNKMVQLNAVDIKAHMEQQLGLKVDLQFSQSDGNDQQSNQREDAQDVSNFMNGNANNFGNGQNLSNQNEASSSANNSKANEGQNPSNTDNKAIDQQQNPIDGWVG